jgi:signal transduction histidine kinase
VLDSDPAKAAEPLEYVLSLADAGLTEMRALIFELRPEALEVEGLVAVLGKQMDSVRARHGLQVNATIGTEPDVPFAIKEAVYRIAQEALNNAVRHAHARRVDVRLDSNGDGIALEICDDGKGFDPEEGFPGHLGLRTMRERAIRLGGTLDVESGAGHGTRIRAWVPAVTPAPAPQTAA